MSPLRSRKKISEKYKGKIVFWNWNRGNIFAFVDRHHKFVSHRKNWDFGDGYPNSLASWKNVALLGTKDTIRMTSSTNTRWLLINVTWRPVDQRDLIRNTEKETFRVFLNLNSIEGFPDASEVAKIKFYFFFIFLFFYFFLLFLQT